MKLYKKIALTLCVAIATSCSLDLRQDPNAVQPNQVLPSLMLNSIQRQMTSFFEGASGVGQGLTRQINRGGTIYFNTISPEGFNGVWSTAYADVLQDVNSLLSLSVPDKTKPNERYARHMGIARIIQAYTIMSLVDMFGKVPFSEAFQGELNFNPVLDEQLDLYNLALVMLDSAKLDLTTNVTTATPPGYLSPIAPAFFDMYYGGGAVATSIASPRWIKLANTLKLKIYLNMRKDPASVALAETQINALINDITPTGGLIGYDVNHVALPLVGGQTENFIFRYGTTITDPAARHPSFAGQYPGGGGDYQSNWLMWSMLHGYDAVQNGAAGDPRLRFYFYRQRTANSNSTNEIRCVGEAPPTHYPAASGGDIIDNLAAGRFPMGTGATHPTNDPSDVAWTRTFCYPSSIGYWGRDHINPEGIPPDGLLRTAYGPYPVGGRYDNNNGVSVAQTQGMQGAGMAPIMMRSYVNFMLAEAQLYLNLTGNARTAAAYFNDGMAQSFADVRTWATTGTLGTTSVGAAPNEGSVINTAYNVGTYNSDFAAYMVSANAAFADAMNSVNFPTDWPTGLVAGTTPEDEAMNYVAREFWIASFGNGIESYNMYRRNAMPTGLQPVLSPTPGPFPRSYWYPANTANLNNQVTQKGDLTQRVFWDTNTTNLDF